MPTRVVKLVKDALGVSVEPLFRAPPLRLVRRRAIVSTSMLGTALILFAIGKMLENCTSGIYFAHLMDLRGLFIVFNTLN